MQGLYVREPLHGYVKAMIEIINGEVGYRHVVKHHNSPLYLPFSFKRDDYYTLHRKEAVWAEDITPGEVDISERYWRLHPLEIKGYERERMDIIFKHMEESLETLVQQGVHLDQKKLESRRRFLGIFPDPLRESFNEGELYGTIGGKQVNIKIYTDELPSRKGEYVKPHSSRPIGAPFRFFNS